jgi:hypothetical protein
MVGYANSEEPLSQKQHFPLIPLTCNLRVHHGHIVKEWVKSEEAKRKLEIFGLPSCSPELNPDEYLNCDLKHGLSHKPAPRSVKELRENVENPMTMLQQTPSRIAKYFKHESIKYAA